ncbi:hypothetical protein T265_00648 [Opisthorchis viverrini]|uniref:Uncharacterized protein n=1 Tax=Opisthorchis viverrini TaxID=6198 RepID=A0A075A1C5_OPIVI|nr:hypothetical protein T265_00648 [Opisthorchis viverrini]KER33538.1 hypothetical protein T265_00648 [Opisthorchis viverrini]
MRLTETRGRRLPDEPQKGRNQLWAVEEFPATLANNMENSSPRTPLTDHNFVETHQKRIFMFGCPAHSSSSSVSPNLSDHMDLLYQPKRNTLYYAKNNVRQHKLRWSGHVLRMLNYRLPNRVLFSVPSAEWRNQRGDQPLTW